MDFSVHQKFFWEGISAQAGLSPSIGKCYYSDQWLQINSENFLYSSGEFVSCPYINFSLTSDKQSRGNEVRHWTGLGAAARAFVEGFDDKEAERLLTIFLRRQKPLLEQAPAGISWWLPEHLGGLGLPLLAAQEFLVTKYMPPLRSVLRNCRNKEARIRLMIGPLVEGMTQRPYELLENGPNMRVITAPQACLAFYLRDLLRDGKEAFRVGLPPRVPEWVNEGMRLATHFQISIPQPESKSWSEKKIRYESREAPAGENFTAFMWEALGRDAPSTLCEPDLLLNTNKWYKNMRLGVREFMPYLDGWRTDDVTSLFLYNPPQFCLPGGLEMVYRKLISSRPVGLYSQISAASAIQRMCCAAGPSFGPVGLKG